MSKRLAAILAADVVDYSRLMGEDDARALQALRQLRSELFEPIVREHEGEVIKRMGDGWLVKFSSVGAAVKCAIAIQLGLVGHEVIKLRVGIHIGDVTFEDEDIFGDGVNVAARLEALALPGNVLISDTAYNSLDAKLAAHFDGGEAKKLKNISRPVPVWNWIGTEAGARQTVSLRAESRSESPGVAVLAFANMSGDAEQEYFSDGIAEDIITELSRFSYLKVIARNSSFTYKGQSVDLRRVGKELGVRYILEGSVRKAGNRVRVTAQLIDTRSGDHIWADRFDRDLDDIFAVQDEITRAIIGSIAPSLEGAEMDVSRRRETANLDSWELTHRAHVEFYRLDKDSYLRAIPLHRRAVEKDQNSALAKAYLALSLTGAVILRQLDDPDEAIREAEMFALKALDLDRKNTIALWALGQASLARGNHDKACRYFERAISLNANDARNWFALGSGYIYDGRYEAGIEALSKCREISPRDPLSGVIFSGMAFAYFQLDSFKDARLWIERSLEEAPGYIIAIRTAAAIFSALGELDAAKSQIAKLQEQEPTISLKVIEAMPIYSPNVDLTNYLAALRKAGLPES